MPTGAATVKHYGTPISRARALYRIPTSVRTNRTLELHHNARASLLEGFGWPGVTISCQLDSSWQQALHLADNSFDLIILHRTLDDLANASHQEGHAFDATAFLQRVSQVLAPGGLVAGCVDNRVGLKSMMRRAKDFARPRQQSPAVACFTLGGIRTTLNAASFNGIRTFTLLPNSAEPLKLIDTDPEVSKIAFRHELQIARQSWSLVGYLARRFTVELGLYPHLEESIFFWANKRC